LQNIGPDALVAISPQLADMLYGRDLGPDADQGLGKDVIDPDSAESGAELNIKSSTSQKPFE
jgi:hypothetical protein